MDNHKEKEIKRMLDILNKTMSNIESKLNDGKTLKDAELRFLDHYPELRRKYLDLLS